MHESLRDRLFSLQDTAYRDFHSRLIPNIDPERVIGIRTPALRAFAKEFSKTNEADEFLASLPLHAMLLCEKKDFAETVRLLDAFLPHVDNWATCDLMRPKAFPGDDGELYAKICEWIASDHVYTVRFALVLLMTYFLDGAFPRRIGEVGRILHKHGDRLVFRHGDRKAARKRDPIHRRMPPLPVGTQ